MRPFIYKTVLAVALCSLWAPRARRSSFLGKVLRDERDGCKVLAFSFHFRVPRLFFSSSRKTREFNLAVSRSSYKPSPATSAEISHVIHCFIIFGIMSTRVTLLSTVYLPTISLLSREQISKLKYSNNRNKAPNNSKPKEIN